jgi:hypothetical protein
MANVILYYIILLRTREPQYGSIRTSLVVKQTCFGSEISQKHVFIEN